MSKRTKDRKTMKMIQTTQSRSSRCAPALLLRSTVLLALLAGLVFAPTALATPTFGVSVSHSPSAVSISDYEYSYSVQVKNTGTNKAVCEPKTWTGSPTFAYQWLRDGAAIPAATSISYEPVAADVGHSLQCKVTATNAGGGASEISSPFFYGSPSGTLPAPKEPLNKNSNFRPTITTVETTKRLCTPPTNWAGTPLTWTYQWLRNGVAATSAEDIAHGSQTEKYEPQTAGVDKNTVLQCEVLGKNSVSAAAMISNNLNIGSPSSPPSNAFNSGGVNNPSSAGAEWTSGTTALALGLPDEVRVLSASGTGWTCQISSALCTSATGTAPGSTLPVLTFRVVFGEGVPATVVANAIASGAGAVEGVGQDSLTFGPAIPFEIVGFNTKTVNEEGGVEPAELQAGEHPFSASAELVFPLNSFGDATRSVKEIWTDIPAGFVGNVQSVQVACRIALFEEGHCPAQSAVGGVQLSFKEPAGTPQGGRKFSEPITAASEIPFVYRLRAEKGYPAEFGFIQYNFKFVFRVKVRTESDYGITIIAPKTPQVGLNGPLSGAALTFCEYGPRGVAGSASTLFQSVFVGCRSADQIEAGAASNAQPLMTVGTECADGPPDTKIMMDSWEEPGAHLGNGRPDLSDPHWKKSEYASSPISGCQQLTEEWVGKNEPSLTLQPDNTEADTPAGYTAHLHIPQEGLVDPTLLATSHLDDARVVLAPGPTLNPSVGDGISVCTEAQMGLISESPIRFDEALPHCPDGSKLGNALVSTPLLENPLRGSIYLAAQHANPFGSDYAIYLAIEEPDSGIVVKLAGKVEADPVTGQLTTAFAENPQLPYEDLILTFFSGSRSSLANPVNCGLFTTESHLTPWSAADPRHPLAAEIANPTDPISIVSGPGGAPCSDSPAARPFKLGMTAGSENSRAGATSPFNLRITRADGNQEVSDLTVKSPPGYAAYLKGIPACSEASIKAAEERSGLAERESPSCSAASKVGSIVSGAGAGSTPLFTPGNVYLGGPYKGAPLSLVTITPALAGGSPADPAFDLGNVVVRVALYVDRQNAAITGVTDSIPRLLKGIPLRIRDIRVSLDRPNFGLNPTDCDRNTVSVIAHGSNGASDVISSPFQVGGCDKLAFAPKLKAHLTGGTKRGKHPAFTAELTYPEGPGYANIKDAQVTIPHSEFLDQAHINTICTRVQAAANACPAGSIYGYAEAETPLLDGKLTGPVFLKSSDHQLPDLAIALRGPDSQPVEVEFQGRIDSIKGQIRNTIEGLPDVPVSKFVLRMKGGKKGLLVNSRDLCAAKVTRMTVDMTAQNNKTSQSRPALTRSCKASGKTNRHHNKHSKRSPGSRLSRLLASW